MTNTRPFVKHFMERTTSQAKLELATEVYRRALEISPKNPNIHYGLGVVCGRQGAWETAETHFARAANLIPAWVSPWLRLSDALRKLGRDDEAKKAMARARALDKKGDEIGRQFVIANILEEDGQVEEAVEVYRKILTDDPESSRGWWLLGKALNQLRRWSAAKAANERAVDLSFYWAAPYFGLAESLQGLQDLDGAEKAVRRALELNPGLYDAHVTLAHILDAKRRFGEAETQLRESLSRFPSAARLHSYLGSVLNKLRKNPEAEQEFRTAIKLEPNYEQAFIGLAMALRVQGKGKLAEAIECNKTAININSDSAEGYFGLAMCHLNDGRLPEAADNFRAAIEHCDNYPEAHYFLAKSLARLPALEEAAEA